MAMLVIARGYLWHPSFAVEAPPLSLPGRATATGLPSSHEAPCSKRSFFHGVVMVKSYGINTQSLGQWIPRDDVLKNLGPKTYHKTYHFFQYHIIRQVFSTHGMLRHGERFIAAIFTQWIPVLSCLAIPGSKIMVKNLGS